MSKKRQPTFTVKFTGRDVSLETVSLRTVADAISSIQRLALGSPADEIVKADDTIHLVGVKRGSAVFKCFTNISGAVEGLRKVNDSIHRGENEDFDLLLRPVEKLSEISRRLKCEILVQLPDDSEIARFDGDSYDRVSAGMISEGETTIFGKITRVGGSTRNHCAIRIFGRKRLLHCQVADAELARKLGKWLYKNVALSGKAKWIGKAHYIAEFKVYDAYRPKPSGTKNLLSSLRKAGGSDWDNVENVDELLSRD